MNRITHDKISRGAAPDIKKPAGQKPGAGPEFHAMLEEKRIAPKAQAERTGVPTIAASPAAGLLSLPRFPPVAPDLSAARLGQDEALTPEPEDRPELERGTSSKTEAGKDLQLSPELVPAMPLVPALNLDCAGPIFSEADIPRPESVQIIPAAAMLAREGGALPQNDSETRFLGNFAASASKYGLGEASSVNKDLPMAQALPPEVKPKEGKDESPAGTERAPHLPNLPAALTAKTADGGPPAAERFHSEGSVERARVRNAVVQDRPEAPSFKPGATFSGGDQSEDLPALPHLRTVRFVQRDAFVPAGQIAFSPTALPGPGAPVLEEVRPAGRALPQEPSGSMRSRHTLQVPDWTDIAPQTGTTPLPAATALADDAANWPSEHRIEQQVVTPERIGPPTENAAVSAMEDAMTAQPQPTSSAAFAINAGNITAGIEKLASELAEPQRFHDEAEEMRAEIHGRLKSVRIKLQPEKLGEISISVHSLQSGLRVEVRVQNDEAGKALLSDIDGIAGTLAGLGLAIEQFTLTAPGGGITVVQTPAQQAASSAPQSQNGHLQERSAPKQDSRSSQKRKLVSDEPLGSRSIGIYI